MPPVDQAYNALKQFSDNRPQATDYVNQGNDKYNVTGAQQNVGNLQSLVGNLQSSAAAVAPSVTGRTTGTFTTQGQRDALIAKEQQPILGSLNQQQNALGQAQDATEYAQSNANQYATTLMNQDQQKYQALSDQYSAANAFDQFNKQQQSAAASLAEQQRQFNAQLAEQQRQFNLTPRGGSGGGVSIGGGAGLAGTSAQSSAAAQAAAQQKTQQQQDYNFVQSLVQKANAGDGDVGVILSSTIASARQGNERSKDVMRAFYQMKGIPIPQNFRSFL